MMQNTSKSLLMCERKDICICECCSHILIQMCTGAAQAVIFRIFLFMALLEWQLFVLKEVKGGERLWGFANWGSRILGLFYLSGIWCWGSRIIWFILFHWNLVLKFQRFGFILSQWNLELRFQDFGFILSQRNSVLGFHDLGFFYSTEI